MGIQELKVRVIKFFLFLWDSSGSKDREFYCDQNHFVPDIMWEHGGYWCGHCGKWFQEDELYLEDMSNVILN